MRSPPTALSSDDTGSAQVDGILLVVIFCLVGAIGRHLWLLHIVIPERVVARTPVPSSPHRTALASRLQAMASRVHASPSPAPLVASPSTPRVAPPPDSLHNPPHLESLTGTLASNETRHTLYASNARWTREEIPEIAKEAVVVTSP